jgi:hypothetical protein
MGFGIGGKEWRHCADSALNELQLGTL